MCTKYYSNYRCRHDKEDEEPPPGKREWQERQDSVVAHHRVHHQPMTCRTAINNLVACLEACHHGSHRLPTVGNGEVICCLARPKG